MNFRFIIMSGTERFSYGFYRVYLFVRLSVMYDRLSASLIRTSS